MEKGPQDSFDSFTYIAGLILKEMEDKGLSEQERRQLVEWISYDDSRRRLYESLKDRALVMKDLERLNSRYHTEEAISRVFEELGLPVKQRPAATQKRMAGRWQLAAAAVLILVLGASLYLFTRSKPGHSSPSYAVKKPQHAPVAAGKAVLTLSDSSQITLDTLHNGEVGLQGNSTIVKKNGQLVYQKEGKDSAIVYNTMTTPKGGQYRLVLADGTRVWLNAASSLTYPTAFAGKDRKVKLVGEAYFEVSHDRDKPFVVTTQDMSVTVLGTKFNLMAYADEDNYRTTLLEGSVRVAKGDARKTIRPGEQAIVSAKGGGVEVDGDADIDKAMAWRSGFFKFDETDTRTLMREIARWYDIDIIYETGDYSTHYGGRINRNIPLPELLKLLEGNGIGHYKLEGRKLTVLP